MDSPTPIPLTKVLAEEYVRLNGDPSNPDDGPLKDDLKALYRRIHKDAKDGRKRTALSISGGGIRSATFALGIMQQLARFGILEQFDYLSTVSGGGYIGSWLSSFARRSPKGIDDVSQQLREPTGDPANPEIKPIQHLRRYSNYLTPQLGLFSGDTWALVGSYLRNVLLIWLMFVPLLIAVLTLPRFMIALLRDLPESWVPGIEYTAGALMALAILYLGFARPVHNKPSSAWFYKNSGFKWLALLPFTVAATGFLLVWPYLNARQPLHYKSYGTFAIALAVGSLASSLIYMIRFAVANRHERREAVKHDARTGEYTFWKGLLETAAALISGAVAAGLIYAFLGKLFPDPLTSFRFPDLSQWLLYPPKPPELRTELYVCFGVPVILATLFLQSTIFVGLASWYNEDYDREWWARAAGWALSTAFAWIAFSVIAIFGPVVIWEFPRIAASLGAATGLFSVLGGKNDGSKPSGDGAKSKGAKAFSLSLNTAGALFAVLILAALSLATSEILLTLRPESKKAPDPTRLERTSKSTYQINRTETITLDNQPAQRKLESEKYPALELDRYRAWRHLWIVDASKTTECLALILGGIGIALFSSIFVGVNRFSMHAFYRNRLIRAYLGASRWKRRPNPFSGFDPNDNIAIHKLRTESFWTHSFSNIDGFATLLKDAARSTDTLLQYMAKNLSSRTKRIIGAHTAGADPDPVCESLAYDLNRLIDDHDLATLKEADETSDSLLPLRNRNLLQQTYGAYLNSCGHGRPFHIVNTTLNLVKGDELAWQERKGDSFTASPLHCGNRRLGYRYSRVYGGPSGISLGTVVAISGAAASPNMGYNSSPGLAFLLTLFNVRLGWWLGNPGRAGDKTYRLPNPTVSFKTLLDEALGLTNDKHPYVYLSDGGHFENLALYEMVLRRCHTIIISDAGGDLSFGFNDLGNAVRKIRIDQGIDIKFDKMFIFPRSEKNPFNAKYCALATIDYKQVDGDDAAQGHILYIKPAFYGEKEPRDVYNYAQENDTFPHQSTGDQFFSESQFESYRALGELTMTELSTFIPETQKKTPTPDSLIDAAREYVRVKPI